MDRIGTGMTKKRMCVCPGSGGLPFYFVPGRFWVKDEQDGDPHVEVQELVSVSEVTAPTIPKVYTF